MGNKPGKEDDHGAIGAAKNGNDDAAAHHMLEAGGLTSRLELNISCRGLKNLDGFGSVGTGMSDPFVVVHMLNGGRWDEVGRTEIIANSLDPHFVRKIIVLYHFEEIQQIKFDVYDADSAFKNDKSEQLDLSKQEFQGSITCSLAEIAGSAGRTLTKPLTKPQGGRVQGTITISAEEQANQNANIRLKLKGQDVPSGQKPFFQISRTRELMGGNLEKTAVYKSEVITKYQAPKAPVWAAFEVNISSLCQGDFFRPVVIDVYDWKKNGKHKALGSFKTSPDQLLRGGPGLQLDFGGGKLIVQEVALISRPSFLDYVKGGCELSFIVAIDFTGSNGPPTDPRSLHYYDPSGRTMNQYAAAITYVGEVLQFYDSDKKFPVYGFGGQYRSGHTLLPVSHCFAINGDPSHPEVDGIEGILQAYQFSLESVQLSGPTVFSQVIGQANRIASQFHRTQDQKYFVLLILTDGIINDMDATISEIIRASHLPLSVLVVGVGQADFGMMNVLDGDEARLANESGKACRDIVQFVPFRDFMNPQTGVDRTAFAKALLEELPAQITGYFAMNQIPPNPPISLPTADLPVPPPVMR